MEDKETDKKTDEKPEEESKEEPAPDNSGKGVQSETITELDRADQIAERQKRENDRLEELLDRKEALEARRVVGGRAEAGKEHEKKEVNPAEYAKKAMAGEL